MRRIPSAHAYGPGVIAQHAVNSIGIHMSAEFLAFAIVAWRAEHRPVEIVGVASGVEIGADTLRGIGVDGESVASAALPDDAERVEAPVLVQVFH